MFVGIIIAIVRLSSNDHDLPLADSQRSSRRFQCVDGALRRIGIGIERVESFHRDTSVAKGLGSLMADLAVAAPGAKASARRRTRGALRTPASNSHMEIMGTS